METSLSFINPRDVFFYLSDGGLLCLKFKGEDLGRVAVLRMFPFQFEEEFITIRSENYSRSDTETEVGILRNINELSEEQLNIIRTELQKRYFIPDILEVYNVKEEFGNTSWSVNTSSGKREFTMTDMSSNVRNLGNNKVLLTDVYGSRYYIQNAYELDEKTLKILEIWI